jgi:hypothetical protein
MSDPPTPNAIASSSKLPLDQAEILSLPPSSLTPEILHSTLLPLADIDALTTCSDLLLANTIQDPLSARCIVQFGLARGESDLRRIETEVRGELHDSSKGWETWSSEEIHEAVARILAAGADNERILRCCETISEADKRLETFEDFFPSALAAPSTDNAASGSTAETGGAGTRESETGEAETIQDTGLIIDDPWEEEIGDGKMEDGPPLDDPWDAAGSEKSASVNSGKSDHRQATPSDKETPASTEPPILLSAFLSQPLLTSALSLAAAAAVSALQIIRNHHPVEIFPYRFALLEALPGWTPPGELESAGLLPQMGVDGMEKPWSPIQTVGAKTFLDVLPDDYRSTTSIPTSQPDLLTSEALSQWYAKRIYSLDSLGLLDVQLGWVQFGASLGVPGLDPFGEDLSLLSRLIYDANLTAAQQDRWNLVSWRAASECEVVKAYLSNSSEAGVVEDIKRLVLPYLYVLESRAERAGNTDSHLPDRLLYEAILGLSLHLVLPVFEASKATLPKTDRLVKNDIDVARLALACLYGSDQREIWTTMSAIFECLPVWDVSGGDIDADKEATATTLDSIATFVRPSRAGAQPPTAHDFFIFFSPLPFAALSRALDILDVHLESGEILARWDTAVQPRFLLQSARNTGDQTELAERMVRRQSSRGLSETRWTKLWGDMRKLNGGDDALLRGAFGMLSAGDMMRIYLGGVLGSGRKRSLTASRVRTEVSRI